MTKDVNKNKIAALCFALLLFLCIGITTAFSKTVKADSNTVESFYNDNLELVKTVDADAERFTYLFGIIKSGAPENDYFPKMQAISSVAVALKNLTDSYLQENYYPENFVLVKEFIDNAKSDVQITNLSFSEVELLAVINTAKTNIDEIDTKLDLFDVYLAAAKVELSNYYSSLLKVNTDNPLGQASQIVGFYDDDAKLEVNNYYNEGQTSLDAIVYEVSADLEKRAEVDLAKQTALDKMAGVSKNDIERAYKLVMDYNAIKEGDRVGELDAAKTAATTACNTLKAYWENSSAEIKSKYNAKKQVIDSFVAEPLPVPIIDKNPQSFLQTEDGAVSVYAYKRENGVDTEYAAFPTKAFVTVFNSANSAGKRNASRAVGLKDKKLSVGYFMYIDIYVGTKIWQDSEQENVVYKVNVDLEKYFQNYVGNYDGLIEKLLAGVPFLRSKADSTNRYNEITATENYIKSNISKTTSSLVYCYSRENGEGIVAPLSYEFNSNGGVLMLETTHFSTFAITSLSNVGDLFVNPLFWLIVAAVVFVAIILIIIIVKNIKYSIKFYTNGGSKVPSQKARKGECFAMPQPPKRAGYVFAGWYMDKNYTVRFIDTYIKRRKNKKVYAKWVELETPERIVKYYEKLRATLLSYSKVGNLADMGIKEKEILARLMLGKNNVVLCLALEPNKLVAQGYPVEAIDGETPSKYLVDDANSFKVALELTEKLMQDKGLVFVGSDDNDEWHMTAKEKKIGFTYAIINTRIASTLTDYYEIIRDYANSHVIYDISSPDLYNGKALLKMYLREDAIYLYLAIEPM